MLLSTSTVGARNAQNLANLFNLTGFTNQTTNEIWDTWLVGASSFGKNVRSVLRVAVAADKNKDGVYNDAPAVVPDANGDERINANDAAAEHGLAVTGGVVSTTGIAGLTLGGGLGWLMAKYGLAADNLLAVELVTAKGEVLHVDAVSHPGLFWALRGGGGNFGVATAFTYRLHPLQAVVGGLIAHPIDAAPGLLRFYRDAVAEASDDLTVFSGLVHAPDGSGAKLAALVVFHAGDAAAAERDLEPFKAWGSPLLVEVGPMPYPVMNTILDAGFPAGSLNYWLSRSAPPTARTTSGSATSSGATTRTTSSTSTTTSRPNASTRSQPARKEKP